MSSSRIGVIGREKHQSSSNIVSVGQRKSHSLTINGKVLHNSNKSPYRRRDGDPLINTSQRRYRYQIEAIIKTPSTVRRKSKCIYTSTSGPKEVLSSN